MKSFRLVTACTAAVLALACSSSSSAPTPGGAAGAAGSSDAGGSTSGGGTAGTSGMAGGAGATSSTGGSGAGGTVGASGSTGLGGTAGAAGSAATGQQAVFTYDGTMMTFPAFSSSGASATVDLYFRDAKGNMALILSLTNTGGLVAGTYKCGPQNSVLQAKIEFNAVTSTDCAIDVKTLGMSPPAPGSAFSGTFSATLKGGHTITNGSFLSNGGA